jgi:hypothetical protein
LRAGTHLPAATKGSRVAEREVEQMRNTRDADQIHQRRAHQRHQHGAAHTECREEPPDQHRHHASRIRFITSRKRVCAKTRSTALTAKIDGRIVNAHTP